MKSFQLKFNTIVNKFMGVFGNMSAVCDGLFIYLFLRLSYIEVGRFSNFWLNEHFRFVYLSIHV